LLLLKTQPVSACSLFERHVCIVGEVILHLGAQEALILVLQHLRAATVATARGSNSVVAAPQDTCLQRAPSAADCRLLAACQQQQWQHCSRRPPQPRTTPPPLHLPRTRTRTHAHAHTHTRTCGMSQWYSVMAGSMPAFFSSSMTLL
jgi:hypothetical protein